MSKVITDRLIDDILEVVLEDMDCHHEQDNDEDGVYMSVDYNLKNELKVRNKVIALLKPEVTEEWINKKARELFEKGIIYPEGKENEAIISLDWARDFIRSLVEEIK